MIAKIQFVKMAKVENQCDRLLSAAGQQRGKIMIIYTVILLCIMKLNKFTIKKKEKKTI